ncbi:FAD-dependent monooxygenase [Kitasatospora sp. NBC_01266]|uniref:FAD-dependent monooxygenase n=1 Tax=Kitasatospora sp. NBC_01266 TaxID=2903572 RepID=UPI002E3115FF|nr:FAD-dependent monooxygenase [Kitasatospora sp. NBC_01266]
MTEVLIVGAGPTGLTLACALARRGVAVRVIERSAVHHHESRGKTLTEGSLEIFAEFGIADRLRAEGTSPQINRKYFNGEHVNDTPSPTPAVFIAQWRTEELLRECLADHGVAVEPGSALADFEQDEHGVTATLADGRRIGARYLVGCDGGHSTVRRRLGLAFDGKSERSTSMVCGDVEADGLDRDVWHQWFTPEGALLLWPIPGTRAFQLQASPETDEHGAPLAPSLEGFQRLFDRFARVPGIRLRNASWLSTWRVGVRMVDRMRVGRVFLAGDAAHVHPIAGGLGMNTGIADAHALARVLTSEGADEARLEAYQAERLPVAAWTLKVTSDRLAHVMAATRQPGVGTEAGAVLDPARSGGNRPLGAQPTEAQAAGGR